MDNAIFCLAIALGCGLLFNRIAKKVGLPNVTGYLVAGLIIGGSFLKIIPFEMVDSLNSIVTVALGFIAFSIGGEFKISHIKKLGARIITVTCFEALTAVLLVDVVLLLCRFPAPEAIARGAIAAATAPAATLMVVRQYKAKGPLVDLLLPIVALDDAVGLVLFAVSFGIAKALSSGVVDLYTIVANPIIEITASLLLGAVAGWVMTQIEKLFNSNTNRLAITISFVFLTVALSMISVKIGPVTLGFSSLLVCMMLGSVFCNLCPLSEEIMENSDRWTGPLMVLFFVISGAELELGVFKELASVLVGIIYMLARSAGKYIGARESAKLMRCNKNIVEYLGITLLPQAGVALGMCVTASTLPEDGALIRNIVLFAVLIYELVGPMLTKWALQKAGDIKPMGDDVRNRRERKLEQAKNVQH